MAIFRRGAFLRVQQWQYSRAMRSRAAIRGKFFAPCIPKVASDRKIASSWQHIAAMHPKRAGIGKICAPCIRKAPQTAFRECTARRSCQEGALSAALTLRITHGARILPSRRRHQTALAPAIPAPRPHRSAAGIGSSVSGAIRRPSSRAVNAPAPCSTEAQRGANGAAAPTAHGIAALGRRRVRGAARRRRVAGHRQPLRHAPHSTTHPTAFAAAAPQTLTAPRANQQPSAGVRFVLSKARTHHTYLSAAPVAGFSN